MLKQLYNEHPLTPIASTYTEAQLLHALTIHDINAAQQHINQLTEIQHELLTMYQGDLAYIQQKYEMAEMHYLEALIKLNPTGRYDALALIMNKLNQLYLSYNQQKLNENIQRTLKLKPFIYPVQKYQAMAAHADGKDIEALSLLEELKMKAGDFWQHQDQLLLENWQNKQQ
jgi:hypothetical protein